MKRTPLSAIIRFSTWSLRHRTDSIFPIAMAFLLLVFAIQTIGTLHDISSIATRQRIAQNWRGSYDLLIRPQIAVSSLERTTNWIDPQGILETYGGINDQQIEAIRSLPHIVAVTPIANLGWQTVDVQVPITLPSRGIYRISASWTGQGTAIPTFTQYVDVTDLYTLTSEASLTSPVVTHLVVNNNSTPTIFTLSLPTVQALVGIPISEQTTLARTLAEGMLPTSAIHLSLGVDKLAGNLNILPACLNNAACWAAQAVHQGTTTYQLGGTQLLRYSPTSYTATPQQLADGQVGVASSGTDIQGVLYRTLLPSSISVPTSISLDTQTRPLSVLPFSAPEHLPLIADAVRFISLGQACVVNGPNCYSGLYVRLNNVEDYSQRSLSLLQATAAAITAHTGLHADILDGSSPRTVTLITPTRQEHAPIQSSWRVVGVAIQIVHGLDAVQSILLILCSLLCLLAIGTSGVLVGMGCRDETVLLQQFGWQAPLLLCTLVFDAVFLCLPGCLLAIAVLILTSTFWPNSLPTWLVWLLFMGSILMYCCALVSIGYPISKQGKGSHRTHIAQHITRSKVVIPLVLALTLFASVFLIAIEYLLLTSFDHLLVVTVLGTQVRAALETPQLVLVCIILTSACLTVGLCATLILRGRRNEIVLLAQVGWQRRDVLLRLMHEHWRLAFLSSELAVICASGMLFSGGTMPSFVNIVSLLLCGPLAGFLLVNIATLGPSWQATKRVFVWK
jgi:hypothetical protein